MDERLQGLSNEAAVDAVGVVAREWLDHDGAKAFAILQGALSRDLDTYRAVPEWARDTVPADDESGQIARRVLSVLLEDGSAEIIDWTERALAK